MIQLLRGTKSQLDSYQTVIAEGQPVFEKDTGQLKIGNGSSIYSALPYVGAASSSMQLSGTTNNYTIDLGQGLQYRYLCKQMTEWTDNSGRSIDPNVGEYEWVQLLPDNLSIWTLTYASGAHSNDIRLNISDLVSGFSNLYSATACGSSRYLLNSNFSNVEPGEIQTYLSTSISAITYRPGNPGSSWSIAVGVLGST